MSRRALLGVDDKQGLVEFARGLRGLDFELIATGGTRAALQAAGLEVTAVSEVTGTEEMLEGRVKTLHPAIHAGILARRDHPEDLATLDRLGYLPIDLVACNLYPFQEVVARGGEEAAALEAIDIGGPTLLRAAAKNFRAVVVVSDPSQYPALLEQLAAGDPGVEARRRLAAAAFRMISAYDALVAGFLSGDGAAGDDWPADLALGARLLQRLRYGENPHQLGALYQLGLWAEGLAAARQLSGPELSYTNWLDVDAARRLAGALPTPAAVLVKHSNPCGVALGGTVAEAFQRAYDCDPRSAYGGIVAVNQTLDLELAEALARHFLELVVAPEVDPAARERLAARPRLRLLEIPPSTGKGWGGGLELRSVDGGLLVQQPDRGLDDEEQFVVSSRRQPSEAEWRQLRLAWRIVPGVKSNAIVLCQGDQAVGIGAGQMSRVEAVELAVRRAGERARGAVLASDAYFPMADGLELAAAAGVTAAIHPGGSKRDGEVAAAADAAGLALVATARRHFRH